METNRKGLLNRKWVVAILAYIGLIALCCIVVYGIPSVRGMLERTYIAEHGSIDVTEEVSGFIVRDEVVYAADQKSKISRVIEPGTLVKAGTRVVELTPTEKEEEPEEEASGDETAENGTAEEKPAEGTEAGTAETEEAAEEEPEENTAGKTGKYANAMEELGDTVVFTADGSTKDSGYISYTIDGAEARLTKAAIDGLTEKDLKDLTSRKTLKLPDKKCGEGYPVFKIVRNSKWYLVFFVDNESVYRYIEGDTLTIDINGEQVSVRVAKVDSGTKTSKIVLSCKAFYDGFFDTRTLDTTVTFVSSEGLVIEDDSIVEAPDGKRGVFVKNKLGEHVFTPIRVKADNGKKCVVFEDIYVDADGNFVETISTYDEIIAVPSEEDIASLEETNPAKKGGDDKGDGN